MDKIMLIPEINDAVFAGNRYRVIDLIGKNVKPYFLEEITEGLKAEIRQIKTNRLRYVMPRKLYKHVTQLTGLNEGLQVETYIYEQTKDLLQQFIDDAFDLLGYDIDEFDNSLLEFMFVNILLCEVSVNNLVLALFDDSPISRWKAFMLMIPRRPDKSVDFIYNSVEWEYELHTMYDDDRGDVCVGPYITLKEDNDRKAYIDFVSNSNEDEYIILGSSDISSYTINNSTYMKYSHVEGPNSKTYVTHERIYNIDGTHMLDGVNMYLPVILNKMLKFIKTRNNNIILGLPYPEDLLRLIEVRPHYKQLVVDMLYHILNGIKKDITYWTDVHTISHFPRNFSEVFNNEKYLRTNYTESNHGEEPDFKKIYARMFK